MKKKVLNTFLIALVTISILSCKKDDEKPSKTSLLTSKTWANSKFESDGVDVTKLYVTECAADNSSKFSSDGTLINYTGNVKCSVNEKDRTGTWEFKNNETVFSIHYEDGDESEWKLVELSSTVFKISYTDDTDGSVLVLTFLAQ